jgi:uncharacterized membrane protein (GlpM family)
VLTTLSVINLCVISLAKTLCVTDFKKLSPSFFLNGLIQFFPQYSLINSVLLSDNNFDFLTASLTTTGTIFPWWIAQSVLLLSPFSFKFFDLFMLTTAAGLMT